MLTLIACTSKPSEIEITATPIDKPNLILPPIDELNLRNVSWTVITSNNYEEKITELSQNGDWVIFALTVEGYENLSLNINDIRSMIEQQNQIIVAYKRHYDETNANNSSQ